MIADDHSLGVAEKFIKAHIGNGWRRLRNKRQIKSVDASKLREIEPRPGDRFGVIRGREWIRVCEFGTVKIELGFGQCDAFGIDVSSSNPVTAEYGRKELFGAFVVVAGGNEIGLQLVVGFLITVVGARSIRNSAQTVQDFPLGGSE